MSSTVTATIRRLVANVVTMLQTRLELISVELQEEALRYATFFFLGLCALFCVFMALFLGVVFIIALFWDDHRFAMLSILMTFFAGAAAIIALWIRSQLRNKPRFLEQSIHVLKQDVQSVKSVVQPQTQSHQASE